MDNRSMQLVREQIKKITLEHDKEDRALRAIEVIFMLVCSRDYGCLEKMDQTKLGKAFIDIAEFYGENAPECREKFRF
jgi:hypothetical protein